MNSNALVKKILVLASNPKGTSVLALQRETRDIREGLKRADNRDRFQIQTRGAVAFSSNGYLLASAGDDMQIRLWQAC